MGGLEAAPIPGAFEKEKQVMSKPDLLFLKKLSSSGRGKFFAAEEFSSFSIASKIVETFAFGEASSQEGVSSGEISGLDYSWTPLLVAIICLASHLAWSKTRKIVTVHIPFLRRRM